MRNTFRFYGDAFILKEGVHSEIKSKKPGSTWVGQKAKFGVQKDGGKPIYLEIMGGNNKLIYTYSADNKKLEIPFDSRFEKDVVDSVANFKKYTVKIGNDRFDYISEYDFVLKLKEVIKSGIKILVTGEIVQDLYEGKAYTKYKPTYVRIIGDNEEKEKDSFKTNYEVFYTDGAIDDEVYDEDKKIYISGFVETYDKATKSNVKVPKQFIINGSNIDNIKDEKVKELANKKLDFMKRQFETDGWKKCGWECSIFKGANDVEITIDDLTTFEKEQIELGMKTFDEFKQQYSVKGAETEELRLVRISSQYTADGAESVEEEDIKFYTVSPKEEVHSQDISVSEEVVVVDDLDGLFD